MSDKNILLVPIQLNALYVESNQMVTEAFADFSQLPYHKDGKDFNPDTANLSESILSQPFQNQNLNLEKGIHLHWTLPEFFRRGGSGGKPESYPCVPNRWLITKKINQTISNQWIVESDYISSDPAIYGGIPFAELDPQKAAIKPFLYLGRQLKYTDWKEDPPTSYLPKLTAMGYGEPSFAAFYPNCHSVFGCYDPEMTDIKSKGISYQLLGWYSKMEQDFYYKLTQEKDYLKLLEGKEIDPESIKKYIKGKLGWDIPIASKDPTILPQVAYCFAQLDIEPNKTLLNTARMEEVTLSIGNTGVEAMTAYLASKIAQDNADHIKIEDQLLSLLAFKELNSHELDLGQRLAALRQERSFKAEAGELIWEIATTNQQSEVEIPIPPVISGLLYDLNDQQKEANQIAAHLTHRKHLLFADWYKYMLCAYPPDDDRMGYPDIDQVQAFIEKTLLVEPLKPIRLSIIPELEYKIKYLNESNVSPGLSISLGKKDTAVIPGNVIIKDVATHWIGNLPFSDDCLQFNKDNQVEISLKGTPGIKGLSMWINIASHQSTGAVLLASRIKGIFVANTKMADTLTKVAINGEVLPLSQQTTSFSCPKDQWFHLYLDWENVLDEADSLYLFGNNNAAFLNGKLASIRLFSRTLSIDELCSDMNILGHQQFALKATPGPRYWQPTEPVILLEGNAVAATKSPENNSVTCRIVPVSQYPLLPNDVKKVLDNLVPGSDKKGFYTWTGQPWNPFLLEWQVEVHPIEEGGNLKPENGSFDPGFIDMNYTLESDHPELSSKQGRQLTDAAAIYSGRSILTFHAQTRFLNGISDYFTHLKQEDCYQVLVTPPSEKEKTAYSQQLSTWYAQYPDVKKVTYNDILHWYLDKPVYNKGIQKFSEAIPEENKRIKDFNYTLIQAAIRINNGHFLSQALSGFNNALLMHHQTLQLPVGDPLGFSEYQSFTTKVKDAIEGNNNLAPMPHNDFLPLRTGTLRTHKLRIIDSFGQGKDISVNQFIKAASLTHPEHPDDAWLHPRLVPLARINFRWLSAESNKEVLNAQTDESPICGWLMGNHLDQSVMVYDRTGHSLGMIDQDAQWRMAPGSPLTYQIADIPNPHIRKIVSRLCSSTSILQSFITESDSALDNIQPEADIHHQELALLMGQPMAVVRASISATLKEGTPIHHGWNAFLQDLNRDSRDTNDVEKVKIPVRLGDSNQLNDGLIGYWIEDDQQDLGQTFYSTAPVLQIKQELRVTLQEESKKILTMLVHPPGDIHATTGLLPVKSINIPKNQYAGALKNIHVTFLSTPILTGKDQLSLPLPKELGYTWSFLAKERFSWVEISETGMVRKDHALQLFSNGEAVWQQLLQKGWIVALDENRASITAENQRTEKILDPPFGQQEANIQHWLDSGRITPADTKATFSDKQEIREGWLNLKRSNP
jgi:hypothetical protein